MDGDQLPDALQRIRVRVSRSRQKGIHRHTISLPHGGRQRIMGYNEEKQRQLDMRYLRMARIWAENSYCVRRKVGALIVKDKMIISDGYNGTPSGFENVCEDENGKTFFTSYPLACKTSRSLARLVGLQEI